VPVPSRCEDTGVGEPQARLLAPGGASPEDFKVIRFALTSGVAARLPVARPGTPSHVEFGRHDSREDIANVASQLAVLTQNMEKMASQLEEVRNRADVERERGDVQQERIYSRGTRTSRCQ
jgi:hypothetical protein